ncbi:YczE/YyaS/YitT family protein [Lactobacillaceae bacterium Scapto_B20]
MIKKESIIHGLIYFIGLNILAIGTVMSQYGKLGVGALTSFPQVLSLILPMSIGQAMSIFFVMIVVLELLLMRKIKLQTFVELAFAFLFGYIINFYEFRLGLSSLPLEYLPTKIILTAVSIIITAIGIFVMVKADFVLMPTDALVKIISKITKSKFGKTKFIFDCTSVLIALAISVIFLGHVADIGIGTVATAMCVGQFINLFDMLLSKFKPTPKLGD